MGVVRYLADGLVNALSGLGTRADPRSYNAYAHTPMTDQQIDAAFRGSWLMRKIIAKPAAEMVREWRDWQTTKPNIEKLEAEEKRLDVQAKCERALILAGLGGAGMVIYTRDADQTTALDPKSIRAGGIVALHVWHRSCFTLGPAIDAWDSPWFGQPSYYEMRLGTGAPLRLHPSRVIAFRGQPTAGIATSTIIDWWWGDSTVQVVKDAVDNVHAGEDGFAGLIRQARLRRLKIPKLFELLLGTGGETKLQKRAEALAIGESSLGITLLDGGDAEGKGAETIEDKQLSWAGIPEIKASYLAVAAAAGNMPATVLLGKSPDGMNATGSGDLTVWEGEVKSRQDLKLRPCLAQLDAVLVPSALGAPDPTVWWKYAPLSTPTEAVEATTFWNTTQGLVNLQNTGLVPDVALSKGVQNLLSERGWLPGIDEALAELPEDERFPDAANADETDPSAIQGGGDPASTEAGGVDGSGAARRRAANDAAPRPLYVRRDVLNTAEIAAWAKTQGLPTLNDDLHVTVAFSRTPVDWIAMGADYRDADGKGGFTVGAGGPRLVEPLGNQTAVLLFASSDLAYRHMSMREAGASWDFPEYQPHVSLTDQPCDLTDVEPYRGKIVLGPEIFEPLDALA